MKLTHFYMHMYMYIHTHTHTSSTHPPPPPHGPPDSKVWREMEPPNPDKFFNVLPHARCRIPGSRYGHTACAHRGRVYMFGGRNDEDGSFQTMECYDIGTYTGLSYCIPFLTKNHGL